MPAQKPPNSVHSLVEKFVQLFGTQPVFVQAPGRVNLIGEHTDYNDGFVLPAAIQFRTVVGIAPRGDQRLVLYSENYDDQLGLDLAHLLSAPRRHWRDYVVGVASELAKRIQLPGASILIEGEVPQGAGLSSSASLEVAVCEAFLEVSHRKWRGRNSRSYVSAPKMNLLVRVAESWISLFPFTAESTMRFCSTAGPSRIIISLFRKKCVWSSAIPWCATVLCSFLSAASAVGDRDEIHGGIRTPGNAAAGLHAEVRGATPSRGSGHALPGWALGSCRWSKSSAERPQHED